MTEDQIKDLKKTLERAKTLMGHSDKQEIRSTKLTDLEKKMGLTPEHVAN
jgi:hypothetical protein